MNTRTTRRPATAVASTLTAAALTAAALVTAAGPAAAVRGGSPASTDARPYAMLIELADGSQFCGGTLIAPTKVLTAGHCLVNADDPMTLQVIGGRTHLAGTGGTVRHVASFRVDPGYTPGTEAHDGAVITLKRPMPYRTLPVAGPKDAALYADGRTATVLGWGRTQSDTGATRLNRARLTLSPLPQCDPYTLPGDSPALELCGLSADGTGASICPGDSGGPLVSGGKLIGIVSAGNKYCDDQFPVSVFARADSVAADLGLPTR